MIPLKRNQKLKVANDAECSPKLAPSEGKSTGNIESQLRLLIEVVQWSSPSFLVEH